MSLWSRYTGTTFAVLCLVSQSSLQAQAPPGYLAVLHGNTAMIYLQNPANSSILASWSLGGTMPRKVAVEVDATGRVTGLLIGRLGDLQYNVPSAVTRLDVNTGVHTAVAEFPGFLLSAVLSDGSGGLFYSGRSPVQGGCVYQLVEGVDTPVTLACLSAGRTPAGLARASDGTLLVGWNDDGGSASFNYGNGVSVLDVGTGNLTSLNEVSGVNVPRLADIAIAPGGRIYLAASPSEPYSGGSIAWVDPASPAVRTVLASGGMATAGWGILVRPMQLTVVGTPEAHTVYAADPWGVGGGGGMGGGGGGIVPFNGGLVAVSSNGTSMSRVMGYGTGPFGVVSTGAGITVTPTDAASGTQPVSVTFDSLTAPGPTAVTVSDTGPVPLAGFSIGTPARYYEVTTGATYVGALTVCFSYADATFTDPAALEIHHWTGSAWETLPGRVVNADRQTICGRTTSLSPFVVAEPIPTDLDPPVLTLMATPSLLWPANGATTSVTISGSVTDESAPVSVTLAVIDEYGELTRPAAPVELPVTIPLVASRLGTDRDGREYRLVLTATDPYGNTSQRTLVVRVPHDRR